MVPSFVDPKRHMIFRYLIDRPRAYVEVKSKPTWRWNKQLGKLQLNEQ